MPQDPDPIPRYPSWVVKRALLKGLPVIGSIFNISEGIVNLAQFIKARKEHDWVTAQVRLQQAGMRLALGVNLAVNTLLPNPFLLAAMGYSVMNELPLADVEAAVRNARAQRQKSNAAPVPAEPPIGLADI